MIKRLLFVSLFTALFAVPAMYGQTCAHPSGTYIFGSTVYTDWVANGAPSSTSCWTVSGATVITDTMCGGTEHAFDFGYQNSVSQTINIPSTATETNWDLIYDLTMVDPHDDGWWDRLTARVYDVTAARTIASQTYWGDDPDVNCSRRDLTFTGNLAGHTIKIIFEGSKGYSDTYVRVRGITLYQY